VRALWTAMPRRALTLPALAAALLMSGCGDRVVPTPPSSSLVTGRRAAPIPPEQLAAATTAAETFAHAWAPTIYLPLPPRLPGASPSVRREQLLEAARAPVARRHLRPRSAGVELKIATRDRIQVDIAIVDGRSPTFSIGATLARRSSGWQIVTISTPG
jgi:hypothetical protein